MLGWSLVSITMGILQLMFLFLLFFIVYHRVFSWNCRRHRKTNKKVIAFFHPYCSSGGGGERVLWKMIEVLDNLVHEKGVTSIQQVIIYTIDDEKDNDQQYKEKLLRHVQERFSVSIRQDDDDSKSSLNLTFVHLPKYRYLLEPASSFSLLMESIGAMRLAYHALKQSTTKIPDLYIDTMGCAFTYLPAYLLFGCSVMPYVHYPTISTDMLSLVWERRRAAYNHDVSIAQSRFKTYIKLIYYIVFAILYGSIGSCCCTMVMVNSTWTYNHICSLWRGARRRIRIVFPPCNVQDLMKVNNDKNNQKRIPAIVSIGQFRPEKDHVLQMEALAKLIQTYPQQQNNNTQLVLIGSCRGPSDEERLQTLRQLAKKLNIEQHIQFVVNQPYSVIQEWLGKATIGIHTMWNEHFGIGIVEMMAAGLLTIAHNSGGPKLDIITQPNTIGFLAVTVDEYAECMHRALTMSEQQANDMRQQARISSERFSDQVFAKSFEQAVLDLKLII